MYVNSSFIRAKYADEPFQNQYFQCNFYFKSVLQFIDTLWLVTTLGPEMRARDIEEIVIVGL